MTQGKIERYHRTMKNRILLENYYLLGQLEQSIGEFVEYYNDRRYLLGGRLHQRRRAGILLYALLDKFARCRSDRLRGRRPDRKHIHAGRGRSRISGVH